MATIPAEKKELIERAETVFSQLKRDLAAVSALVSEVATDAVAWRLPEPMDSSSAVKDFKAEKAPQQIEEVDVVALHGRDAIDKCSNIYSRVIRWAQQSPNHTIRMAGVVCVPDRRIIDLVARANASKAEYETALRAIHPTSQLRRKLLEGSLLADVHYLQARREIAVLPQEPDRIGFTWEGQHRSVSNISAGELRNYIVERFGAMQRWKTVLEQFTDEQVLAIVQDKAPSPAANISMSGKNVKKTALMPFIVVGSVLPKITPLQAYARRDRPVQGFRREERARVDPKPLIPELNVHRFEYWAPRKEA